MNNKRTLNLTSPEYTDKNNCKKRLFGQIMSTTNQTDSQDVFSWDKLCGLLDEKLKDVTRKSDLVDLKAEIDELKIENLQLKSDLEKLSSRMEAIDRNARASNIIVSGLSSGNVNGAKSEFLKLCSEKLKVSVNIMATRLLSIGKYVCFTLESSVQAYHVYSAKRNLKGQAIYIQKDYTEKERNIRYNLRQINKKISANSSNIKVRLGEFCIYINNNKYIWSKGKIIANSNIEAEFLTSVLSKCNYPLDVCVKEAQQNGIATMGLPSTQ